MTDQVNVHEAKTNLSKLLARVELGEEIVIARDGEPVAKLVPVTATRRGIRGSMKGMFELGPDFDEPLPWDEWLSDRG